MSRSIVARASYTWTPIAAPSLETAVRQNGDGVYAKAEYSQGRGQHWRATLTAVVLAGDSSDFIGQYRPQLARQSDGRYSY